MLHFVNFTVIVRCRWFTKFMAFQTIVFFLANYQETISFKLSSDLKSIVYALMIQQKKNGSYTRFRPKRRLQLNLKQKVRSYRIVDSPGVSNFLDKFKFTDYERESFACERIEGYINSFISTVFHLWITSSFWTFKFVEQIDFPLRQIYMESKERKSKWINFAICLQLQISII